MPEKQYVVIVGKLFGHKTIHGPFPNHEEAEIWGFNNCSHPRQNWEIVELLNP